MSRTAFRWLLFLAGITVALVDQFVYHGTSFEWTSAAHSTWMDGTAFGLIISAIAANLLRRE